MFMFLTIAMEMKMFMGLFPYSSVQSPDKISKAKANKQPDCSTASKRFKTFQAKNSYSQSNPDKSKHYRTQHMPQSAEKRYKESFRQGPSSGPANHDERKIVDRELLQCLL